jgi:steroid 5-alpha reductase family enzyme
MYWLLTRVSGIPPLEAHMRRSRPEAFEAYAARTSAFFPCPPRGVAHDLRYNARNGSKAD